MKSRTLALRVALNSAVMILAVYLLMQTFVFFRDSVMFGAATWGGFEATVVRFVGMTVLPPLIVFGVILWTWALPLQKAAQTLEAGGRLSDAEAEAVRAKILQFSRVVLWVNLIGFTVGFLLDLALSGRLGDLVQIHRLTVLGGNLCAAFIFSAAQTALNNVAFGSLREQLGLTTIGQRRRESPTPLRQWCLSAALVLYGLFVMQYNQNDVVRYLGWAQEVQAQVIGGQVAPADAEAAWRALAAEHWAQITVRPVAEVAALTPPWVHPAAATDLQIGVFLVLGSWIALVAAFVQGAVAREQRLAFRSLTDRLGSVVAGEGDLRERISLRALDDIGELGDLTNRLLDQMQTLVLGVSSASAAVRAGAQAVDQELGKALAATAEVRTGAGQLQVELTDQAVRSRQLSGALSGVAEASASVDGQVEVQARLLADTASAMAEVAASIDEVRRQSRQAGDLTEALARQGEAGRKAVVDTAQAIGTIRLASQEVLTVLGTLKKISADTNLLAMNAAIEAAHAGQQGAGFAVVADEVRKLAATAGERTKAIQGLIVTMVKEVEGGVAQAQVSERALADLAEGLHRSAEASRSVAEAMEEQSERTSAVGQALGQVVDTGDEIRRRTSAQTSTASEMELSLGQAMARLAASAEAGDRQSRAVEALERSFEALRREGERNLQAAEGLAQAVGRFRV